MRKLTGLDRLLFLGAGLLAAYQVVAGIEGWQPLAVACFTVAFGVLLLAGLLLFILGFEALDSSLVVIAATAIPLSLSLGLVSAFLPVYQPAYLAFALLGFAAVGLARLTAARKLANLILTLVHGVAGLVICILPLWLTVAGRAPAGFALVGLGGALIGLGGLLLSFLRAGQPVLPRETVLGLFPGLLFTTTAVFVAGFVLH